MAVPPFFRKEENVGNISSKRLLNLMDCKKKYHLDSLSMKGANEQYLYFRAVVGKLMDLYVGKCHWDEAEKQLRSFLEDSYREEWFLLKWQKEKAITRDLALMERLWQWLPRGGESMEFLQNVPVETECPISLYDEETRSLTGRADLLTWENGNLHGYIFCRRFGKPYSYRARKADNKVAGSIELLVLFEGLRRLYPDAKSIQASLVRLVSPSDKAGCLAEFDAKKGDNVVTLTGEMVQKECPEGICSHIRDLVEQSRPIACGDCGYRAVCGRFNKVSSAHGKTAEKNARVRALHLSETQKRAVSHQTGAIRVCAGPGSGKTAVLVERVKELVKRGVPPERILAVTFTKKAAQEMEGRIAMEGPVVSTLHALAFGILTAQECLLGTVRLAGKVDCKNLLVRILDHAPVIRGVSYEGITMPYGLISTLLKDFDYINKNGTEAFAAAFPKKDMEGILQVKQMYDEAFRNNGFITYDDQISMTVRLLKDYPGILEDVRSAYDYIMVDEVQDLDGAQAEFICLLAGDGNPNLMICGDPDQSIYGFRGGSNQFMLDFPQIYPDARDIWMEENYRSSKEIVEAASALISQNEKRVPMQVAATYRTGFRAIHIPGFQDRHMPELIREICTKGYSFGDIAIIARTNKQLSKLCDLADREAASGNAVPLEKPKYYLREDYTFLFLLNLLELKVKGMSQDAALYRLLSWMGADVDKEDKSLGIYEDYVRRGLIRDFYGEEADCYWLAEGQPPLMCAFGKIYQGLQILNLPIRQALMTLWEKFLKPDSLSGEAFQKIQDMLYEKKIRDAKRLYELMRAMVVFEDDTRVYYTDGDNNQVHLLTGHDAKGKEFPVVILYEMDEFESSQTEEDRRLLYVAMTRAKRVLFLLESYPGKSAALRSIQDHITINRRERYEV